MAEIAEAFMRQALGRKQREERLERLRDFRFGDPVEQAEIEARTLEVAAYVEGVEPGHAADDADVAGIGARAAVGATGDAHGEPLALEAVACKRRLDAGDERVVYALRLGEREPASGKRRASERPAPHRAQLLGEHDVGAAEDTLDLGAMLGLHVAQQQVLARADDGIEAEAGNRLAERAARLARDPAARDRHAEIEPPVALLMPAQVIAHLEPRHRPRIGEGLAQVLLEPRLRPGLAVLGDHVFEPRMPAVAAVAVVAVEAHHRFRRGQQILASTKATGEASRGKVRGWL